MVRDVINKVLSTVLLLIVLLPMDNKAYCEDNKILISDYLGNWTGKTNQGHPISFRVENIDGVTTVTEVKYKMKLTGTSFSTTTTMMQPATIKAKVIDNKFKHSNMFDFSGTFVKKNLVEGQLKEVYVHPQGYGKAVGYVSYSAAKEGAAERIIIKTPKPPKLSKNGLQKAQLVEAQRLLAKLGFSPGPADGLIGLKTERAVREFQKSSGITVDGKITKKLLEQLTIKHLTQQPTATKPITSDQPGPSQSRKVPNNLGIEFVYVEPGTFLMGSPSSEPGRDDNEIQHQVTLTKGFYMQTTEVTQGQWKAVMGSNPSQFKNCGDDCPVERVSWNDVQNFISKLNQREGSGTYRLPTEAEWEYAARASSTTAFASGRFDFELSAMGWYGRNANIKTHPVAQKKANAWGLYDMHGNVWEWCQDWYEEDLSGSVTDPNGPSRVSYRVFRGGGWNGLASTAPYPATGAPPWASAS